MRNQQEMRDDSTLVPPLVFRSRESYVIWKLRRRLGLCCAPDVSDDDILKATKGTLARAQVDLEIAMIDLRRAVVESMHNTGTWIISLFRRGRE